MEKAATERLMLETQLQAERKRIAELEKQLASKPAPKPAVDATPSEDAKGIIASLAKHGGVLERQGIYSLLSSKHKPVRIEHYLDELKKGGFVQVGSDAMGSDVRLTEKGRQFAVENNFV